MIDIRSVFLLICVVHLGKCQLENFPQYGELVNMAIAKLHSSSVDNFTQPIIDLQSLLNSADYLDYQSETFGGKYSDNPLLMSAARHSYHVDMCSWLESNVTVQCCTDIQYFLLSVISRKMWALKMIDSYGKLPSGLYLGDFFYPGSYDECIDPTTAADLTFKSIQHSKHPNLFKPKYCQIGFHIPQLTHLFNPKGLLTIGICVPDSCAASDIKFLVNTGINSLPFWFGELKNTFICHEEHKFELQAISTLTVCGFIILLVILGTIYDVISTQFRKGQKVNITAEQQSAGESLEMGSIKETSTINESTEELEPAQPTTETSKLSKFLLCFSLHKNAANLLNTDLPKDHLAPVHGLRFISMSWIILGQTYVLGTMFWKNKAVLRDNMVSFTFQAIGNASVSTDSFFLISGMLVVYVGLKIMESPDRDMDWLYFYVHRFWRLTPTYMLVMMVYVPLMQYWGDGPYWPDNGVEENYCRHNWWQNFLYINNFFDKQCMGWMWYLANDMQFYIFSPFILVLLNKKAYRGLLLLLLLLIGQCTLTGFLWIHKERDPRMDAPADIYMRPYTRVGPYLIGMAYGYLLRRNKDKVPINPFLSVLAWLLASGCAVSVLYGLYGNYHGYLMTKVIAAVYMAVHRSVWAVAVGWVIYACVTGNGGFVNRLLSWKGFIPLSRLTYCAYLVHPIVIFTYILQQRAPIYITNFRAAHLYLSNLWASYLIAFVVSMVFEAPLTAMEKLFNKI